MTSSSSSPSFVVVSRNELDLKKETSLSVTDLQELVEYSDIFLKFLDKSMLSYRLEMMKDWRAGKEHELRRSIATIKELKKSIEVLPDVYKKYREEQDKKKEAKKSKE